jgi:hypothetical protein
MVLLSRPQVSSLQAPYSAHPKVFTIPIKSHTVAEINALPSPKNQDKTLEKYELDLFNSGVRARIWAVDVTG